MLCSNYLLYTIEKLAQLAVRISLKDYPSSTRTRRGGSCLKDIYQTFLIYRTCMRRAPAKPVRTLRKWCPVAHVTFEAPLRTSHFSLQSSHYTLHSSHCTLGSQHFTLHTSHFSLLPSHSKFHTSHSTLHTSHSTLQTAHFTLHTTQHSTLHTLHSALHTSHTTLHTPHFTMHFHMSQHIALSHFAQRQHGGVKLEPREATFA